MRGSISTDIQTSSQDWNHPVFRAGSLLRELSNNIFETIPQMTTSTIVTIFQHINNWNTVSLEVQFSLM